ncbi:MAG TPA: DUF2335 domain-containing protein [Isosphaeraceae bacterium]
MSGEWLPDSPGTADEVSLAYLHTGPLPHPHILREYEDIVPGTARAVIEDFREQGRHRREQEAKVVDAGIAHQRLGTLCGTILSGMAIVGGCLVAVLNSPASGAIIAGTASVSLATAFIIGQRTQREEREARARLAAEMRRGLGPTDREEPSGSAERVMSP